MGEIVHIGDTAGVPQQLVTGLRDLGLTARSVVPPVPLASAPRVLKVASLPLRLTSSRRIAAGARRDGAALVHVHYATAAIGYVRAGLPLVVHAHGTDVRNPSTLDRRLLRAVWRNAALRLVSTPDLLERVPSSVYLPNPVDCEPFVEAGTSQPFDDVFVFAAWTAVKGASVLVDAVRRLKAANPDLRITALDIGDQVSAARDAGATIIPRVAPDALPGLIARHRVVLGQQFLGALGVSELQAMATGRPVVTHVSAEFDYGAERPPIVQAHDPEEIASAAAALVRDPATSGAQGVAGQTWVQRHHERDAVCRLLVDLYRSHGLLTD